MLLYPQKLGVLRAFDMANQQIESVDLHDGRVVIRWTGKSEQTLQAAYLRHSPGFPDSNRPGKEAGRFPMVPQGFGPRHAELTIAGHLKLTWSPTRSE